MAQNTLPVVGGWYARRPDRDYRAALRDGLATQCVRPKLHKYGTRCGYRGSGNVSIGGVSAARKGDATPGEGSVAQGSSNVFINGRPAATVGDRTGCGGVVLGSGGGVFINGKPAARTGDLTSGCPDKSP